MGMFIEAKHCNWGERHIYRDWDTTTYKLSYDGKMRVKIKYYDVVCDEVVQISEEDINKLKMLIPKRKISEKHDVCDGAAWSFKIYDEGGNIIFSRKTDAIYGIDALESIAKILSKYDPEYTVPEKGNESPMSVPFDTNKVCKIVLREKYFGGDYIDYEPICPGNTDVIELYEDKIVTYYAEHKSKKQLDKVTTRVDKDEMLRFFQLVYDFVRRSDICFVPIDDTEHKLTIYYACGLHKETFEGAVLSGNLELIRYIKDFVREKTGAE